MNCGNTIFNEDVIVPVVIEIKQLQINPEKNSGLQRDSNPWPESALAHTLGAGQFVEFILTREIKE